MLLPNFYHPFFLYCVKTPTNDDGNFGELEFLCTFVAKSKPLSKTRQSIANRTVSKSLPEHQPIVRNTLLQRVVAFLSKVTKKLCIAVVLRHELCYITEVSQYAQASAGISKGGVYIVSLHCSAVPAPCRSPPVEPPRRPVAVVYLRIRQEELSAARAF